MASYVKRADRREYRASVNDGRGTGVVWIVDGYGRPVPGHMDHFHVVGVHTEAEAIAAAKAEGFRISKEGKH